MRTLLIAAMLMGGSASAADFGTAIKAKTNCTLDQVVEDYKSYKDKTVVASVQVNQVCKKKGCWMEVQHGKTAMRVTFKDYGFFVPTDLVDKTVTLEGKIVEKTVSVEEARHYLADAGASQEEQAKITKPKREYRFIATGVKSQE